MPMGPTSFQGHSTRPQFAKQAPEAHHGLMSRVTQEVAADSAKRTHAIEIAPDSKFLPRGGWETHTRFRKRGWAQIRPETASRWVGQTQPPQEIKAACRLIPHVAFLAFSFSKGDLSRTAKTNNVGAQWAALRSSARLRKCESRIQSWLFMPQRLGRVFVCPPKTEAKPSPRGGGARAPTHRPASEEGAATNANADASAHVAPELWQQRSASAVRSRCAAVTHRRNQASSASPG